jgi:hypothetical protein
MGFDKFAWFRAVSADPLIPGGEKAVLLYCATICVLYGEDTFCVRQETIAKNCGTSRQTVNSAFRCAKDLGYLALSRQRRLGRGHHGGDELRLIIPETCQESLHDSGEKRVKQTGETCKAEDQKRVKNLYETCKAADASTSENDTPIRVLKGFLKGCEEGYGADGAAALTPIALNGNQSDDDPEPARYCPAHMPHGTGDPCPACKTARLHHDRWTGRHTIEAAFPSDAQRRWDAITECPHCDEFGWLLEPHGAVTDRAIRCTHGGDGQ